jgi:C4-dicarboxylate transporter, DctQ subunit
VSRFLGERGQRVLRGFGLLFAAAVCGLLAWHALTLVRMEMGFPQMAFAQVPTWVVMIILPAGFALLALRLTWRAFVRAEA